ncbi:MAG: hypothetical protein VX072_07685 [Pseudomonadota bacterium]|uniref:hypothetical protein n=1 Tax=unclassified Citromicrobium TaxID=2630544 RepID=UPI0006C90839|nr:MULTISPECIES: hypothetical protein [unclassified Citromicrobium]MAN73620.1 hypothetical protein [Henriciella sp.]MAO03146.1 hypothetical protein [Citromicrobium sp.]MEC8179530.1 hypothetical protein [Pseudomonadota bacterium]KPM13746.1 hypothetical protein WG75_12040 [Citromicrobium sp. WPS32]KPM25860.1 hypothetical protein AAJ72_07515 [Citromicrobium sp. RCC1885]|tara:strand:- start:213 stop:434 length:222 start_codon:yes stop_codon:yes gene_type:complete
MDEKEPGNGQDWVEDARTELSGMMKQRMDHPSTKPVLTGAAIGVVGAALLPVITWPVGLAAGAGYMLYRRIKR